jgi:hypothetical protein
MDASNSEKFIWQAFIRGLDAQREEATPEAGSEAVQSWRGGAHRYNSELQSASVADERTLQVLTGAAEFSNTP